MSSSQTRGSTSVSFWTTHGVAWQPNRRTSPHRFKLHPSGLKLEGSTFLEIVPDSLDRNMYRVLLELLYNGGCLGNGFLSSVPVGILFHYLL